MSEHVCTTEECPTGVYFVTAIDGGTWWYMAGPYAEHAAALADVDKARTITCKHDGRAHFMGWGTARIKDDTERVGNLNKAGLI